MAGLALAWGPLAEEGRSAFPGIGTAPISACLAMVDAALAADQVPLAILRIDTTNPRQPATTDDLPVVLHNLVSAAEGYRKPQSALE